MKRRNVGEEYDDRCMGGTRVPDKQNMGDNIMQK